MSWPIGYVSSGLKMHATLDGAIVAKEIALTAANGWIDLPLPERADTDAPVACSLRLRVSVDRRGSSFLYAEEVEVDGRRFSGLYALAKAHGSHWLADPVDAVRRLLARVTEEPEVVASILAARGRVSRVTLRDNVEHAPTCGADETWDHRRKLPALGRARMGTPAGGW